jgi:mono/diheme cytochrome c family protein
MKCKFLIIVAVLLSISAVCSAQNDGAELYKKKCAGCHGASGEGKPATKAPALKGTQLDESQVVDQITKGKPDSKPPHTKGMSGLTEQQAKQIAEYIKALQ